MGGVNKGKLAFIKTKASLLRVAALCDIIKTLYYLKSTNCGYIYLSIYIYYIYTTSATGVASMVWHGMVEVCKGAAVDTGGWVLTGRHDLAPCAADSLHRVTISVNNKI